MAELQDEKRAVKHMHYALEAEETHAALYEEAREAAEAGRAPSRVQHLPVLGRTVVGAAPESCPLCGEKIGEF